MKRLFVHGTILTCDADFAVFRDAFLATEGADIVYVGERVPPDFEADEIVDCARWTLMPGLINAHVHLGEHIFRGWMDEVPFEGLFYSTLFRWEAGLSSSEVLCASRVAAVESLKAGVTTVGDMYHHSDATAQAVADVGLRAVIGQKILGFSLDKPPRLVGNTIDYRYDDRAFGEQLKAAESFAEGWNGSAEGRISTALCPHATNTLTADMLARVGRSAQALGVPVHMHLAQMESERETVTQRDGMGCVQLLDHCGVLDGAFVGAHGIFVEQDEMRLLSRPSASVVHNPIANAKDAGLIAPIHAYQSANVHIALGTDAFRMDLLEAARFAAYIQRTTLKTGAAFSSREVLRWATVGGAQALGLAQRTGCLEAGKAADIIAIDMTRIEAQSTGDPAVQILNYASPALIRRVYVDGHLVCSDGEVASVSEYKLARDYRQCLDVARDREGVAFS